MNVLEQRVQFFLDDLSYQGDLFVEKDLRLGLVVLIIVYVEDADKTMWQVLAREDIDTLDALPAAVVSLTAQVIEQLQENRKLSRPFTPRADFLCTAP